MILKSSVIDFISEKATFCEISFNTDVNITFDLTIEFWLFLREWPIDWTNIAAKIINDHINEFCFRLKDSQTGQWYYGDGNRNVPLISFIPKDFISLNKWTHIACVRKVNEYGKIYIDGVLVKEKDWSLHKGAVKTDQPITLMANPKKNNFINGKLFDFRIWNAAKDIKDIKKNMHKTITTNKKGLVVSSNMLLSSKTIRKNKKADIANIKIFTDSSFTDKAKQNTNALNIKKDKEPKSGKEFKEFVSNSKFDFIDFGCSLGESIIYGKKKLGGNHGLGIDIAINKIDKARKSGYDVVLFDINQIPDESLVRFAILSHFLEHVPNIQDVEKFIRKACIISKEFVFIRQPYFDADGYLFQNGLKLFWSDWNDHPNHMTTLAFYQILSKLKDEGLLARFSIHGKKLILSTDDSAVHPISSPPNSHHYDKSIYPPKQHGKCFKTNIYYETVVYITKNNTEHYKPFEKIEIDETFFY